MSLDLSHLDVSDVRWLTILPGQSVSLSEIAPLSGSEILILLAFQGQAILESTQSKKRLVLKSQDFFCTDQEDGNTLSVPAEEADQFSLLITKAESSYLISQLHQTAQHSVHISGLLQTQFSYGIADEGLMKSKHAGTAHLAGALLQTLIETRPQLQTLTEFDQEIQLAIRLMNQRPECTWTIQKLADEAGISRSSMAFKFKNQTGKTLNDYLMSIRMKLAETLLRKPQLHINQIAHMTGYQSVSAFSTVFKRWSGDSPSAFRKSELATSSPLPDSVTSDSATSNSSTQSDLTPPVSDSTLQ